MICKGHHVAGSVIDKETRCAHYHSKLDVIAIKFHCCDTYFPCYRCHEEAGCKNPVVWPNDKFDELAVLCGCCGNELTVTEYLNCEAQCPYCEARFNPGCSLHEKLYFEV